MDTKTNPLVSIIMPSYNASKFITKAIESVLAQTYQNWELLITDDYSSDNSVEIIQDIIKIEDRIKLFRLKKNVGAAVARNHSLREAKGKYIAFLDSDDLWKPNKLERQLELMLKNNWAFTFSNYDLMSENGCLLNKEIKVPSLVSYDQYLKNTIIGCLTVVIDKAQTGDFEMPLIKSSHDMALWLLIMRRGFKAYGIRENLATYRLVSTSNTAKKWKAAKDVWKVYRNFEHLDILRSSFCFLGYSFNAILKRL